MIAAADRARGGRPTQLLQLTPIGVGRDLVASQMRVEITDI